MNPSNLSGFDPRVQDQLAQLSLDQDSRSNPASSTTSRSASRSSYHSALRHPHNLHNHTRYNSQFHHNNMNNHAPFSPWDTSSPDAFPPLGATRPVPLPAPFPGSNIHFNQHHRPQQQGQPNNTASAAAQDFFSRARGNARGRGRPQRQDNNDFGRPPRQNDHRSAQNQPIASNDRHHGVRHRTIDQADYLDHLAQKIMTNMLSGQEIDQKHHFRQRLEALARHVSEAHPSLDPDPKSLNLKLQSYGSLSNSFGTSGCDVDLLLTVDKNGADYIDITEQYKLDLEQALLDLGIGARLLTNTRIPIIRVCERPSPALLDSLREYRKQRDAASLVAKLSSTDLELAAPLPLLPESHNEQQSAATADFDPYAADVPLPRTPVIDQAKLEFIGDCGIQCDINFTNHVALHNTKMLWTYGQCDIRVRHMGIFVKNWAKARAINTPYHGTLSSYGYVLMVLHYLINIAKPPVIPNLQDMAYQESWGTTPADSFEGCDIRYVKDLNKIRAHMANFPKNQNSLGALLHGFFRYYASHDGFSWTQEVISIRSFGGVLTKEAKEWTGAKWTGAKQNVRLRYLLAIEDPFELEHNVARTVGHNGIKAIRDEFRRSWAMIQGIQRVQDVNGTSWLWTAMNRGASGDGLDFIEPFQDRGDLLKKDGDFRKEQVRLLKERTENDEELIRKQALTGTSDDELGESYGMSSGQGDLILIDTWTEDQAVLIHDVQLQDKKVSRMRGPDPIHRKTITEEDDSGSDEPEWRTTPDRRLRLNDANEWPTDADLPISSEIGSDDWTTAYESNSPDPERYGENFTDPSKVTNKQRPWDSWDNHDKVPLNGSGALQQVTSVDWDAPDQHAAETTRTQRTPEQPFSDWNDPIDHRTANIEQDRVGSFIKWSSESMGGRWLLSRDAQIRAGRKIELTAGDRGYLNAKFPYDPEMTHQQLAEKNDQLEKYYKSSLYRRQSSDMQSKNLAAENVVVKAPSTVVEKTYDDSEKGFSKTDRDRIIDAGLIGNGIYWSTMTGVGHWLHWRDRKILAGLWNPRDSVAALLSSLFPRSPTTTVADQTRMNWELDNFFFGLDYPRPNELTHTEMDEAVDAIKDAVKRTQEHRAFKSSTIVDQSQEKQAKSSRSNPSFGERRRHPERSASSMGEVDELSNLNPQQSVQSQQTPTAQPHISSNSIKDNQQSRILLDILKLNGEVSPKNTRHTLDPEDRNVINARSMQAVMNLSGQLSKNSQGDGDFVRARRLKYYLQPQQVDKATESTPANPLADVHDIDFEDERKDSATEGSWNNAQASSYGSQPFHLNHENLADLQKTLKNSDKTIHSGNDNGDN